MAPLLAVVEEGDGAVPGETSTGAAAAVPPFATGRALLLPVARAISRAWAVAANVGAATGVARRGSPAVPSSSEIAWLERAQEARVIGTGESRVLRVKLPQGDLFIFNFGAVVCWGFDRKNRSTMLDTLQAFAVRPLNLFDRDEEFMDFVLKEERNEEEGESPDEEVAGADAIKQDQIILTTNSLFEKLAHSYALAQSVRLGVFELMVDRSIARTRSIPETMAATGDVALDARELSKQMGGLLMLRCDVNLHTDILDTPDIFWHEETFETHYLTCRGYLDIDKRVEILNQRLGVLKDLYDLLQNTLNVKHGNKLEWIIIILILVEVVLELVEVVHDAWSG